MFPQNAREGRLSGNQCPSSGRPHALPGRVPEFLMYDYLAMGSCGYGMRWRWRVLRLGPVYCEFDVS